MTYFAQKKGFQATPHPSTCAGIPNLYLDATDTDSWSLFPSARLGAIVNKATGANDYLQNTEALGPAVGNNEIDFGDILKFLRNLDLSGYPFSTSDGISLFFLVKSDQTTNRHQLFDFGERPGDGYGISYRRDEVQAYTATSHGGVTQIQSIAGDSGYRRLAFVIKFDTDQTIYLNNSSVLMTAITLSQLTSAEIKDAFFRGVSTGPPVIGAKSTTVNEGTTFYGTQLKGMLIYTNHMKAYNRERLDKFLQILLAR